MNAFLAIDMGTTTIVTEPPLELVSGLDDRVRYISTRDISLGNGTLYERLEKRAELCRLHDWLVEHNAPNWLLETVARGVVPHQHYSFRIDRSLRHSVYRELIVPAIYREIKRDFTDFSVGIRGLTVSLDNDIEIKLSIKGSQQERRDGTRIKSLSNLLADGTELDNSNPNVNLAISERGLVHVALYMSKIQAGVRQYAPDGAHIFPAISVYDTSRLTMGPNCSIFLPDSQDEREQIIKRVYVLDHLKAPKVGENFYT